MAHLGRRQPFKPIILQQRVTGSTTTSQNLSGSLTLSGSLAKSVLKSLAGSLTSSGALAKACSRALSGTTTLTGTLAKAAAKPLTGSVTPSGSYSSIRVLLRSFSGAVTAAGSLTRSALKGLTGTASLGATLAKAIAKPLVGSTTPGGSLGVVRVLLRVFTGTVYANSLARGLEAYYRFENGLADYSGNGRDLSGSPSYGAGVLGRALTSGSPSRTPLGGLTDGSAFSINAWLKIPVTGFSFQLAAVSFNSGVVGLNFQTGATGPADGGIVAKLNVSQSVAASGLTTGVFHHVSVTYDTATLVLYVDGVLIDSVSGSPQASWSAAAFAASAAAPGSGVDEVSVYSRAIDAAEVLQLYNAGAGYDPTKQLTRSVGKGLVGTLTSAGASVVRAVTKAISGLLTLSGLFTKSGGSTPILPGPPGPVLRRRETWRTLRRVQASRTLRASRTLGAMSFPVITVPKTVVEQITYVLDFRVFREVSIDGGTLSAPNAPAVSGLTIGTPTISTEEIDGIPAGEAVLLPIAGGDVDTDYTVDCNVTVTTDQVSVRAYRILVQVR